MRVVRDMTWLRVEDARCADRSVNPEWWFPSVGENDNTPRVQLAKQICASCVLRDPCLTYALEQGRGGSTITGIWGGAGERTRRKLNRGRVA